MASKTIDSARMGVANPFDMGATDIPSNDLKMLVTDETYQCLKAVLLVTGKGRRPNLPQVECTNRLLLQLHFLREDGGRSGTELHLWVRKLFPTLVFPSQRITRHIDRLLVKCQAISSSELPAFLSSKINLDFISEALSERGVFRNFDESTYIKGVLSNQIVLDLESFRIRECLKTDFVCKVSRSLSSQIIDCDDKQLTKCVCTVFKLYKNILKQKSRKPDQYKSFLASPFSLHNTRPKCTIEQESTQISSSAQLPVKLEPCPLQQNNIDHLEKIDDGHNQTINQLTQEICSLEQKCSLGECQITALQKDIAKIKKQKHAVESSLKQANIVVKHLKTKNLYRRHQRLSAKVDQLVQDNTNKDTTIKQLQDEVHSHKEQIKVLKTSEKKTGKKNIQLSNTNSDMKEKADSLKKELEKSFDYNDRSINTRKENRNEFTDDVRKTVISLVETADIAANKCSKVISAVSSHLFLTPISLKDLPCTQSVLNILDEAHCISKYHAAEKMSENCYTLHSDGTSRSQKKFIGHQVTLSTGESLNLGFCSVASEDAKTLVDVSVDLLQELSDIYSQDNEDCNQLFKNLMENLTSTMSDRAAVMKSFGQKLDEVRKQITGTESCLQYLYCNAHFLLGVSRRCETTLKALEAGISKKETRPLGRDSKPKFLRFSTSESASARIIRLACDLLGPRGDDKSGLRQEWLAFLEEEGVPKSVIPSYRSNRFNCFFQGAAAVCFHKDSILKLFKGGFLSHKNLKIESLEVDLQDPALLSVLQALCLFYYQVTGPYWKLVNSKEKYHDFFKFVQKMVNRLDTFSFDPSQLFSCDFSLLGKEFDTHDEFFKNFLTASFHEDDIFMDALKSLCLETVMVAKKQLSDFLPDGCFGKDLPEDQKKNINHCPLTNILGENAFGDLDFDIGKRRHCSLHHRSTVQMLKQNSTISWLNTKNADDAAEVMKKAKEKAQVYRQHHKKQEKIVMLKVREKMIENERIKKEKEVNEAKKKTDIVAEISKNGGPCVNLHDVDRLLATSSNVVSAVKAQIRYLKVILGAKHLTINGSKEELIIRLRAHFGSTDKNDEQPCKRRRLNEDLDRSASDDSFENDDEDSIFHFDNQGQFVAVFYDNNFYLGQVISVLNKEKALVKFMEKSKGRKDYFKWPLIDDVAEIDACYVFRWGFDVSPVSNDGRVWSVPNIKHLQMNYDEMIAKCI